MKSETVFNDEIDISSLLSILFLNLNLLVSIFFSSILVISIYYFSSQNLYESESLLSVRDNKTSLLPDTFQVGSQSSFKDDNPLKAEIEIYRSDNTIKDALNKLYNENLYDPEELPSVEFIRKNLEIENTSKSLMQIKLITPDEKLSKELLNLFNEEFVNDRRNFFRESSRAGREFIQTEVPRIKELLKEAEENLNSFKLSTNTSDVIFDTNTRNFKLEELKNRFNEIIFKELELKEFYKENHPIYLTLTEQKNLVLNQISEIEDDLPNIPNTQRALENFKREVDIYSNVLGELSSQELNLSMLEASSVSNVRIINSASESIKIFPRLIIYFIALFIVLITYIFLIITHFLGDRITNFDALVDFIGKEKIIGELPMIEKKSSQSNAQYLKVAEELLNKTIYEITNSELEGNTFSIISSRKGEGKTEISMRLFNKLKLKYKTCLIDLDYRKKGITKEIAGEYNFKNFEEFNQQRDKFTTENGSIFVPSLDVNNPHDFFTSKEFLEQFNLLKTEFDYLICDTPPWRLFIDAKIISKLVDQHIYVVASQTSTFRDIELFLKEILNEDKVFYFYNKFELYFNFLWYKYQYPYYSRSYYYDYSGYGSIRKNESLQKYFLKILEYLKPLITRLTNFFKNKS